MQPASPSASDQLPQQQPIKEKELKLPSVWKLMQNSKNMELVRKAEEQFSTPQTRMYKTMAQYSSYYMLFSLLGLSALNFLRGFQPRQHELKHAWSKPAHIFFLTGTLLSLAGAAGASYMYMQSLPTSTRKLMSIADDARILMDLDRLEINSKGEGEGKEVVVRKGTLKELIQRENSR